MIAFKYVHVSLSNKRKFNLEKKTLYELKQFRMQVTGLSFVAAVYLSNALSSVTARMFNTISFSIYDDRVVFFPFAEGVGSIRLYRNGSADTSQSWSSGIVQIYFSFRYWGNICDNNSTFGQNEADVICHQLGYAEAISYERNET